VKVFPTEYKRALGEINAKSGCATTGKAQSSAKKQAAPAK
jgi:glutamate synthase (NADPH) large chain